MNQNSTDESNDFGDADDWMMAMRRLSEQLLYGLDSWPLVFGSTEKAMKKLFAPAKPVVKRPPLVAVPALQETRMGSGRHHRPEGDAAAAETEPVAALVPCLRPAFRVHDGRPHLMQFRVLHRGDDGHAQKHVPHRAAELRDHRHRSRTRGR